MPAQLAAESARLEKEQSQEARVRALLAEGIPTPPAYVFELSTLLSCVPVDLRRVCRVIRTDPSLAAQVIRLCNSAMLGLRGRVSHIEHAVILLGTERLRTLVLTCSLVQHLGNFLSSADLQSFWQHSLLTATRERCAFCLPLPGDRAGVSGRAPPRFGGSASAPALGGIARPQTRSRLHRLGRIRRARAPT